MVKFEILSRSHDRKSFDCGVEALNQFLKHTARQNLEKGLSRTFVLIDDSVQDRILGFYTIALFQASADSLPIKYQRKYRDRIPAVKLARLAVSKQRHRQGFGKLMIIDAIKRVVRVADQIGIFGFFVDAKNHEAKSYYEQFEFISLPDNPLELFLPLATLKELFTEIYKQ